MDLQLSRKDFQKSDHGELDLWPTDLQNISSYQVKMVFKDKVMVTFIFDLFDLLIQKQQGSPNQ